MESTISSSVMEEFELMKQAKYRVYLQNIDKSLKNFEYSSEWADLISALGKLNKVISSYPQFQVIPRRIKISKRLAQCMHPCLPSGVHLKALETYDVIFSNTGLERLAAELFIYSAGLFPLLGYAAMNVRPTLLEIYEKYFVPLKDRLRPALGGFLNGVLPALESGLDHYERTNHLLKDVCKSVGPNYFYTCLWECVATNSSIRLPAITFLLDNYNKKLGLSEQPALMGRNVDLMMSGLCACLTDSVILVQRNTLEFLLLGFPLHTSLLSQTDLVRLVTNGLNTILRRDMSLNRRLYSWLLGTEVNKNVLLDSEQTENGGEPSSIDSTNQKSYFEQNSKLILVKALKTAYKNSISISSLSPDLRPHKILLSLLDKVEIGPAVLDAILIDLIRAVVLMEHSIEVKKSANTLFGNFDPFYIWNFLTNQFETSCKHPSVDEGLRKLPTNFENDEKLNIEVDSGEPSLLEICYLLEHLLDILSLEMFSETTRIHLPKVLFAILKILTIYANDLREDEITASIKLCTKIVTHVQPIFLDSSKVSPKFRKILENRNEEKPLSIVVSQPSLEKSKSDSKLNQRAMENRGDYMKRSKSNHSMGRKKSQKKTKKTKSLSRVSELDKDITCSEQGQLLLTSPNTVSVPNLDEVAESMANDLTPSIVNTLPSVTESTFAPEITNKLDSSETENQHQKYTILEKCSRQYEIFFEVYISLRLLKIRCEKVEDDKQQQGSLSHFKDEHLIEHCNDDITSKINSLFSTLEITTECRLEKLQNLLHQTVSRESTTDDSDEMNQEKNTKEHQNSSEATKILNEIIDMHLGTSMRTSVKFAEQLLVLMSTIPNYDQNLPFDFQDEKEIPAWLKVLVLSAAYFKNDTELRINSISTLFELIGIVKCQKEKIPNSDVHNLLMLPLMKFGHVVWIERQTRIFQILISALWDYLGKEDKLMDAPQIAFLLYQLHSCLESGLVEKVISERMGNSHLIWQVQANLTQNYFRKQDRLDTYKCGRLDGIKNMLSLPETSAFSCSQYLTENQSCSFKKFELLWHFGREHQKENFDKILLQIYDNMSEYTNNSSLRAFIEKWLKESMLRGDLGRLLMPLLKTMLSSQSKRISISNIHLLNDAKSNNIFDDRLADTNDQQQNRVENEVYVIKMGDGVITNHLESNKKRSPIGSVKKILNIATNKNAFSGQKMREKGLMPSLSTVSLENGDTNNISLIVNPLEEQESGYVSKSCPNSIVDENNASDSSSEYTSTSMDSLSDNEASDDVEKVVTIPKLHDESGTTAEEFFSVMSMNSSKLSESEDKSSDAKSLAPSSKVDEKTSDEDAVTRKISKSHQKGSKKKNRKHRSDRKIATERLEKGKMNVKILKKNLESDEYEGLLKVEKLHPFHTHLLMYYGIYDTKQVLYCIETMKNLMVGGNLKLFLCLSINTSVSEVQLKHLLIRHRKSIFGKGFDGSLSNTEFNTAYRGAMYIEILITLLLYYARSYFPPCANFIDSEISGDEELENINEMSSTKPSADDILMNNSIQLVSIELLTLICNELQMIVKEMGKGLASFIADLLIKCKVQKVVLHCLLTSVHYFTMRNPSTVSDKILKFNDPGDEKIHLESIQLQLLKLVEGLIKLEHETIVQKGEENIVRDAAQAMKPIANLLSSIISQSPTRAHPIVNNNSTKFIANQTISQQPMFLTTILSALHSDNLKHVHRNWTELVTSSLKCFSSECRSNIVVSVMHQICENIDKIDKYSPSIGAPIPSEYCLSLLEALTVICHFCLLDNNQQVSLSHLFNPSGSSVSSGNSMSYSGQIYSNILNLFLSTSALPIVGGETYSKQQLQHNATRICVLSHLPRILSSVAFLWENEIGEERLIRQQLLEFLTPIALHHGCNFIAAISVVWHERADRKLPKNTFKFQQPANEHQKLLIKLVQAIKVMPFESLVQTINSVIKSPPQIYRPPSGFVLSVSALEFFYVYIKNVKSESLSEAWVSLLSLLKDSSGLLPSGQFMLFCILHDFCKEAIPKDKKDLRDVHDITAKLVESISAIAGACLEQTTWLRRNLAVKEGSADEHRDGTVNSSSSVSQYSIEAQSLLAHFLVSLLDFAFGSLEKDKITQITQIIAGLMYNIVPYLKNHTAKNVPFFYACSHLMSTLSNYQFTRKAWRKDILDLFLDQSFFQIDSTCLPFWKQIIDNLMIFDNTSFRELLNRLSIAPTGSLNIFTSKEQEYEQKALLLKKLAFVIFCSEKDHYQKHMPEIQEQLSNCLRLPQVIPCVQAAVLLCFRVLLLRMSTENVTSLWPTIIAEVVQVFIFTEQELMTDTEEFSQHIRMLSGLDTAWISNSNNGLSHSHPSWRSVQLETAKLLELGCILPATNLPHFQMYRWAFVGSQHDYFSTDIVDGNDSEAIPVCKFIPHVARIAQLMDLRYTNHSPNINKTMKGSHLVLTNQTIESLQDLYGFFSTLSARWPSFHLSNNFNDSEVMTIIDEIEQVLSLDFLEPLPTSGK